MKIPEVEELSRHLAKGQPLPVVLVAGGDDAVHDGVEALLSGSLEQTGATVSTVHLDAGPAKSDAWERLGQVADNPPMFGEGFVVAVSNCDAAKVSGELKAFLESPAPHVRLALFADRKAARSGLGKAVGKVGKVISPKDLREPAAVRVAGQEAREAGLRMDSRTAAALVDLVGGDRSAIATAVKALRDYRGEGGVVGEEDLRGLVTRTSKPAPWDLDDAVAARNLGRCLKVVIRNLEDGRKPGQVFYTITNLARRLLVAKDLASRGATQEESMERLGINHPFPWKRIREASARYEKAELEAFIKDVPRLDLLVKRKNASEETVFTAILSQLVGRKR